MIEIDFHKNLDFREFEIKEYILLSLQRSFESLKVNEEDFYISIFLTNDADMKQLNKKFRNINKSTNVLSFIQDEKICLSDSKHIVILGDIVISLEKIKSEAKIFEKKFSDHLMHMCVHGFLHLFGYNHEKSNEAQIMQRKEITILRKLSIPSPY